jgi:hypothetical protein
MRAGWLGAFELVLRASGRGSRTDGADIPDLPKVDLWRHLAHSYRYPLRYAVQKAGAQSLRSPASGRRPQLKEGNLPRGGQRERLRAERGANSARVAPPYRRLWTTLG